MRRYVDHTIDLRPYERYNHGSKWTSIRIKTPVEMSDKTTPSPSGTKDSPKKADFSRTLNLPQTDFPMKADLPRREPEIQRYWEEIKLYHLSLEKHAPKGSFILHDGPPYSNGNIHLGTMQGKVLKDVTTRYRTLSGFRAPFVPGWDNHGMPIENAVSTEFRKKKQNPSRLEIRRACREYAARWVNTQRDQFKRVGVRGEWDSPYLTMSSQYEARLVEIFGDLAERGFLYRGLRPIHWCPNCRTAVAGAEIEYDEQHVSLSIYVRFRADRDLDDVFSEHDLARCYTIIWTTTPWTIPANMAIAVNPQLGYLVAAVGDDRYLLAEALAAKTLVLCGLAELPEGRDLDSTNLDDLGIRVVKRLLGSELRGLRFRHPLYTRESVVALGEHVSLEVGTGLVHTAPGHGIEDFVIGQQYHLPALCPVDEGGIFTEDAGRFAGMHIDRGGEAVVEALKEVGALLHQAPYVHSYPTCWRCKGPVIFRATVQWFMNLEHGGHRERCLKAIDNQVKWYPPQTQARIRSNVANRPDWCISRQRAWGVGIPVIYCDACHNPYITTESIALIAAATREKNNDVWFERDVSEFLPPGAVCSECGGARFSKETDTLSVWFDSGSSCRAVLEQRQGLSYPADLYIEGYDQLRAWFNESLMIGMATRGRPPYREVVTHGFTVDEQGRKMSKSLGNVIEPDQVMQIYGADILRWMAMSVDYFEDMRIGETQLKQYAEQYRDIRNRFRFMLGNLNDFDPAVDALPANKLHEVDRWVMSRLQKLVEKVGAAYDSYQYQMMTRETSLFLSLELSAFYLDVVKDRLYTSLPASGARRSAQTALYELARSLAVILSPILVHTMEEVWSHLPGARNEMCSVHLERFPLPRESWIDSSLEQRWEAMFEIRREVQRRLDALRREGVYKRSQDSSLELRCAPTLAATLREFGEDLASIFLVSAVSIEEDPGQSGVEITVKPAEGEKCARCWNVRRSVGAEPEYPDLCSPCAESVRQWPQ